MISDDPLLQDLLTRISNGLTQKLLGHSGILAPIFLLSTTLIAFLIWRARKPGTGFLRWAFPREIWGHPSHRTDIKVFLFSGVVTTCVSLVSVGLATKLGTWASSLVGTWVGYGPTPSALSHPVILAVAVFLILDLCAYWSHRLTHDWAVLWPFHETHHSAEVMTPITVYRRHPVDDLFLQAFNWIGTGLVLGVALGVSVGAVSAAILGGVSLAYFVFNLIGANLRHSHVWLSYGPVLEHIFISPAQHQVHHSCDPRHHDRNYGQVLAIWDWMFGTLYVPQGHEELTFGLADARGARLAQPHGGLRRFLIEPFRGSLRAIRRRLGRP
ncbi:MAG: sterol desaturase family protein [Tabrizicola sp.]